MREIRTSGSEGGGTGYSTGPPYPYQDTPRFHPSCGAAKRHVELSREGGREGSGERGRGVRASQGIPLQPAIYA